MNAHIFLFSILLLQGCKQGVQSFGELNHSGLSKEGIPVAEECWNKAQEFIVTNNVDTEHFDVSKPSASGCCPGAGGGAPYTMSIHLPKIEGDGSIAIYVDLGRDHCWSVIY